MQKKKDGKRITACAEKADGGECFVARRGMFRLSIVVEKIEIVVANDPLGYDSRCADRS